MNVGTVPSEAYRAVFVTVLIILAVLVILTFIRVVKGPRLADRVVGVNVIGTLTIMMICILSVMLSEGYLLDVALIYAMISFLAVVVLTKIYLGVYLERTERRIRKAEQNKVKNETN